MKKFTIHEIRQELEVDELFVYKLEKEEIIRVEYGDDGSLLFDATEVEKLRFAKILIEEMDVNLPGVEVILKMRRNMTEMRRQFDTILEEIVRQLRTGMSEKDPSIRISHKDRDQ